jgi:hypothetical protein
VKAPTLTDLEYVLEDLQDPIEARWTGTREEIILAKSLSERQIILHVRDELRDRAVLDLGLTFPITQKQVEQAKTAITSRQSQEWRQFAEDIGNTRAALTLTRVASESLNNGKNPRALLSVVSDLWTRRVNAQDADVLMRLRSRRTP